ncbi:28 kDa heat- and acid-stable phosphoprotein [Galendromus occidentalis]|uniref:28 kDa heat- and acid-stable phosphoprotein n=1 Tax=Galendromus occidentalis TaxID=34638 RepID=A0AAJ6QY24_9ACAR|nr:28 kDa heat- and acid-stable phosphoprotein [Galendromus occidentalis]
MPPKGKSKNYKGRSRHFTSPEEVEAQQAKEEKERAWRERKNVADDDEDENSEDDSEEESSEESSGEEEGEAAEEKKKGVEGLIEIENPNRAVTKPKKTTEALDTEQAPELSRREREEIQKQKARAHYEKMHAAGRTDQARADLARLAIVRKQREEQARKKAEEKRLAEEKLAAAKK